MEKLKFIGNRSSSCALEAASKFFLNQFNKDFCHVKSYPKI